MSEYTGNENFDWDATIENDGQEYIILPEGDYVYTVMSVERAWQQPTAKIPNGCNKAIITLEVQTVDGPARVVTNLLLTRSLEWKLCAFFRSVGMKKHGEPLVMNWAGAIGKRGLAHIKPRKYTAQDGQERQANDLDRWIDYDQARIEAAAPKPQANINDDDIPF